jgi:hypothetical protein
MEALLKFVQTYRTQQSEFLNPVRISRRKERMPKVKVNGLNINYEKQGSGEPLILVPFLTADHTCYAFQIPVYLFLAFQDPKV